MKTFSVKAKRAAKFIRRSRPSLFAYRGPLAKAQRAQIRAVLRSTGAQAKLTIGQPNDKYEHEADRVADQVIAMPDPHFQRKPKTEEEEKKLQTRPLADQITPLVQRQQESPEEEGEPVQAKFKIGKMIQRMRPECAEETAQRQPVENEENESLQVKSTPGEAPIVTPAVRAGIRSLQGGGQPLAPTLRSFFESRFGADFSNIHVHNDTQAADAARLIGARAFTLGRDVVFGVGQYAPRTPAGRKLLAHELTHTMQQGGQGTGGSYVQRTSDSEPQSLFKLRKPEFGKKGPAPLSLFNIPKPIIKEAPAGVFVTVYFGQNQFLPTGDNFNAVMSLVRHMGDISSPIGVDAHASTEGGPEYNWQLSEKRRNTVISILAPFIPSGYSFSGDPWGDYLSQVRDIGVSKEERERKRLRDRRVEIHAFWKPTSLKKVLAVPESVVEKPSEEPPEKPPEIPTGKMPEKAGCPFLGPEKGERPKAKVSYGVPLTLEIIVNPEAPVPTEAKLGELFTKQGLTLSGDELKALLEGRQEGIEQLETILNNAAPSLGPGCARELAEKIADGRMGESLGGKLGREHPGLEERRQSQEERMRELMGTPDRGPDIQGGVKLIINFELF